jgi:hypothetical protein
LMTKNFGMPWFWLSNNWMPTTKARNFLWRLDIFTETFITHFVTFREFNTA